jgi:hypothetical protein
MSPPSATTSNTITTEVMREMNLAFNEKRIRTSSSLSVFKKPDISIVKGGTLRISADNGRVFECTISIEKVSLQIGGKPEANVTVKGGLIGPSDKSIWLQILANKSGDSFFWLEINVSEPSLRQMHSRSKNAD